MRARLLDLVGNPHAYAIQHEDGTWSPVRAPLNAFVLNQHKNKHRTVGTYVLFGDKARTLVFDIDTDGNMETAAQEVDAVNDALTTLGIPPGGIGVEFSGRKGYHVWVVFGRYVEAAKLRRLGRAVLALAQVKCEVFPKQDEARDLGNLIKLPEGKHQVTGKENNWLNGGGGGPDIVSVQVLDRILEELPEEPKKATYVGEGESPYPCMGHIQEGVGEGNRNNALFHLAVMLRRQGLSPENLVLVIHNVNQKFDPPLPEEEVDQLLQSSAHSGPICDTIGEDLGCGELCIFKRTPGLKVRPGAIRNVRPGEGVVVVLTEREGKTIDFEHPDLVSGLGTLK
jgi:hypothetical protein